MPGSTSAASSRWSPTPTAWSRSTRTCGRRPRSRPGTTRGTTRRTSGGARSASSPCRCRPTGRRWGSRPASPRSLEVLEVGGVRDAARGAGRRFLLVHALQARRDARVAPVEHLDQLPRPRDDLLDRGAGRIGAGLAVRPDLRVQLLPLVLDLLDRVLAERLAALLELLQLLRRVVLLEHRHGLQGLQDQFG